MAILDHWSVGRKLAASFLLLSALMCGVGAFTYEKLVFLRASDALTAHSYKIVDQIDRIMASMTDRETGLRGYLLSGADDFLDPYRTGGARFETAWATAHALTSDNAAQQRRLDAIRALAVHWQQAPADTGAVTTNIAHVSAAANDTGAAAFQVLSSAGNLNRQTERLDREVRTFLTGVRSAS